ncbi:MAG: AAA family ATPase [Acidimicrobiia bacterium]|nr:AAA family ATPase [Acidimicrobiia bacterium]
MRPERLELQGFTAFREQTVVDFAKLELFALTGPTGSGKSSLIDAITFALYGAVPRHGRVEPVISSGMNEARVRFDFELDDRHLTAVRVVRRSGRGASTSEARLEEKEGDVLASGVTEVTAEVTRLIGLSFTHFTRSVVLPQGDFARLLHDTPADRQEFLKELLDLGVLERVRELGKQRLNAVTRESEIRTERLRALEYATEEAEEHRKEKERGLASLVESVGEMSSGLAVLESKIGQHNKTLEGLSEDRALLVGIERPAGLDSLSDDLMRTERELTAANELVNQARKTLDEVREHRFELPTAALLEQMEERQRRLRQLTNELNGLVDPTTGHEDLEQKERKARGVVETRTEEHETLKVSHAAAALLSEVTIGDPCPVCRRPLEEVPTHSGQDDVDAAHKALIDAREHHEATRKQLEELGRAVATYRSTRDGLAQRVKTLQDDIAADGDLAEIKKSVEAADKSVKDAEGAMNAAASAHEKAMTEREEASQRSDEAKSGFERVRYGVARLDPPEPEDESPKHLWDGITTWATQKIANLDAELNQRKSDLAELTEDLTDKRSAITELFHELDLEPGYDPGVTAVRAHEGAAKDLETIRKDRKEADEVRQILISLERDADLAKSLIDHLRANRFEGWLLEEALHELVDGANHLLNELSSGNFSLDVEDRAFAVIDHRNLDARRGVRTLSGGETFLVSLALALSLASQLAEISTEGTARLDAIFLDEGFGSLDAESLETVASVVTELASRGRIVGLVTHVRELAEQMPVRFVVVRDGAGARVERHDR